jgi:hypothetical protein
MCGCEFHQSTKVIKAKVLQALTVDKTAEIVNDSNSNTDLVSETNPSEPSSENHAKLF